MAKRTGNRVTFREEKEEDNIELELRKLKEWVKEEINGIKESIKESLKEGIRNMERKEKVWEDRLSNIEEGIGRMERDVEDLKREYNIAGEEGEVSDSYVGKSRESRSRRSSFRGSGSSAISEDRLSSKEIERLKRMVTEKERAERRNNIVIKGIDVKELDKDRREWAKDFLKSRLGVACGIISVRISGPVIIVKIDKEEDKKWVMRNKNRLKGGKIFIENDLTWEERKRQERIGRWVKEQRSKGEDVKAGYARVRIKGVWKTWEDIERDLNKEDMREGEGIGNKGVDFWRYIGEYDFISLSETWIDEVGWSKWKDRLPKTHEWGCKYAVKEKRKGRAKGGFIIGKRRKWGNRTDRIIGKDEEDLVVSEIEEGARGNTVIDYVFSSERVYERVVDFRVGDRVDSDHMLVIVTLEDKDRRGRRREQEEEDKKEGEEKWRICWDEESIQWYKENLEMAPWEADRQDTIEEKWDRLKCMIHEAMIKKKVTTKRKELGHKDWWDKQCSRKKREVQRCYKRWRKGRVAREKYLEEKKRLRELTEKKQRENREREEKELRKLKNTTQVWSFINKRRKKKEWKAADISKEAWRKHFMNLLEGETIGQEDEPRMSRETEEETITEEGEEESRQKDRWRKRK
ncbi:golgin subfamily A member 6-like protein 22 [Polyergus mexicanus]|uniref:golgin subfamily A member 6-like protein 22 n=1 Tax=Polyergus mexicanus TaxID=615972 RepID=UPI0038B45396